MFYKGSISFLNELQEVAEKLSEIGNCKTIEAHLIPSQNYFIGPVSWESGVPTAGFLGVSTQVLSPRWLKAFAFQHLLASLLYTE